MERDMEMTEEVMTIREMCEAFDVTPRALRFYESKELLFPIRQGQKRLFTRRDRARLKLILKGKGFGFSLEDIRQILDLYGSDDQGEAQVQRTLDVAQKRLAEMTEERDALEASMAALREHVAYLQGRMTGARQQNAA
jgi:DNA-binding transcriptional MerR regulator